MHRQTISINTFLAPTTREAVVRSVTSGPGLLGKGGGTRVLAIKGAARGGAAAIYCREQDLLVKMTRAQTETEFFQTVLKAAFALSAQSQEGQPTSTLQPPGVAVESSHAAEGPMADPDPHVGRYVHTATGQGPRCLYPQVPH